MITGTPTMIYVDGFNFYYGALKGSQYRWLNFETLFARLFPRNKIVGIRYFTALVNALPTNPDQPARQQLLLRAMRTLPLVTIIEGHYLSHPKSMPLVNPAPGGNRFAQVLFTEEKGSDVNLASYLLMDGFKNQYDCAIVISGDSDLATPITMARQELHKTVGVLLPQRLSNPPQPTRRKSARLREVASFYRDGIRTGVLAASQFPATLTDQHGTFSKPVTW
jgi:uncharacterized LabA/DUF88 family protein